MLQTIGLVLVFVVAVRTQGSYKNGGYSLEWTVQDNEVIFDLKHDGLNDRTWTGVAFGSGMGSLDVIEVAVSNGNVIVSDKYTRGYSRSREDGQNNVRVIATSFQNGAVNAKFARPLAASGSEDKSLEGCLTWWFPTRGGGLNGKHYGTPKRMNEQCCAAKCGEAPAESAPHTTPAPSSQNRGSPPSAVAKVSLQPGCDRFDLAACGDYIKRQIFGGVNPNTLSATQIKQACDAKENVVRYVGPPCCNEMTLIGCWPIQ